MPGAAWQALPFAPAPGTALAPLATFPDGAGRELTFGKGKSMFRMFVVRRGEAVSAFVNRCPHMSLPLNSRPDEFMTSDGARIMCRMHLAVFRVDDGMCESGACEGSALEPMAVVVRDGVVLVSESP
jgi:nitrite reductase/ring-hydroxylating ferredoxin subunit